MIHQLKRVRHATSRADRAVAPANIPAWHVLFRCTWIAWITNACLVVHQMQHPKTKAAVIVIKIQVGACEHFDLHHFLLFVLFKLKAEIKRFMIICCYNFFFCRLLRLALSLSQLLVPSVAWKWAIYLPYKIHCFYLPLTHPRHTLTVPLKWKFIAVFRGFKSWAGAQRTKCYAVTFFFRQNERDLSTCACCFDANKVSFVHSAAERVDSPAVSFKWKTG